MPGERDKSREMGRDRERQRFRRPLGTKRKFERGSSLHLRTTDYQRGRYVE